MNKHIITMPTKYIKGDEQLESDKLLILNILMQGRTTNNTTAFSIRYLCQRLDSSTGNTNRTKFLIDTLEYFENNKILFFSDYYDCENKINIRNFTTRNKIDVLFGEFYDKLNEEPCICYNDMEIKNILQFCKNNKLNKYLVFHMYLYLLKSLGESLEDSRNYVSISVNEIKLQLNINKETFLKYMDIFEELNIFYHKSTGIRIKSGYKNIIVYYCRPKNKLLLNDEVDRVIEISDTQLILKPNDEYNIEDNNYKIHSEDLENIELKGVYLIRNLDNKMLKIGVANNLKSRINEIRSNFKFCGIIPNIKIECFIEINNNYKLESHLHSKLKEFNHQNEWFNIDDINIVLEKLNGYMD